MSNRILFGLLLILLGIIFFIDELGVSQLLGFDSGALLSVYWPLILVFIGIVMLLQDKIKPGLFFVTLGGAFQVAQLYEVSFWQIFWPFLLIWFGISILIKSPKKRRIASSSSEIITTDEIDEMIEFSESTIMVDSDNFKGGKVRVAFGEAKIDLTKAKLSKDGAELTVNGSFAGIKIYVPKSWKVKPVGSASLGSWKDETSKASKGPELVVSGSINLGEVIISNR